MSSRVRERRRRPRTAAAAVTVAALLAAAPTLVFGAAGSTPASATVSVQDEDPLPTTCEPQDQELPFSGTDWAQERLNFRKAWPFTEKGAGVQVAVIDTGIGTGHPQLASADIDEDSGANFFEEDEVPPTGDCDGHGTGAAGIIAGQENQDYSTFVGVAPEATLIPIRVTIDVETSPDNALLADAVDYAVAQGADIINISFESTGALDELATAIAAAIAQDVVVVAPSGNHQDQQAYPAAYPGVIGVGAITQDGTIADFSGYRAPVSVVAPGDNLALPWPWGGHLVQGGTSFAAPYVTGVVALVIDRFDGTITPAEVKRRIELTADESGHDLPDEKYGWGVVNPYAAVTEVLPTELAETSGGKRERVLPLLGNAAAPDNTVRNAAVAVTAGGVGAVLLTIGGVAAYRRGRARGWRPGVPQASEAGN